MSVLVATPSRGMTTTQWAMMLRRMKLPADAAYYTLTGYRVDLQRNECVKMLLQSSLEWLLFIDDDVMAPPETFDQLASHGQDVVAGLYYHKFEPIEPMVYLDRGDKMEVPPDFAIGKLIEADLVGSGCMLIHRRVLEAMAEPWFLWTEGDPTLPARDRLSDDFYFCRKAKAAGFKVFMDTGVRCLHIGLGSSELGGMFLPFNAPVHGMSFSCGKVEPWLMPNKG